MNAERFEAITGKYGKLRCAVVGDFCLDRYLEIDPQRTETSIETGLPVYNVTRVRAQPGGAGTVLNNLVALGLGTIIPVGFAGDDGEGYELRWSMADMQGVNIHYFLLTRSRQTFTYCKPLILEEGKTPRELNRLDRKNWTPTSSELAREMGEHVTNVATQVDAIILLGQVGVRETGVLSSYVLSVVERLVRSNPKLLVLADDRLGLSGFPPVIFKMNATELAVMMGLSDAKDLKVVGAAAVDLARRNKRPVITLSERGIMAATPDGHIEHLPVLPVRGEIDVVGAGDAVSANLVAALAAGATLVEAMELANAAASVVVHQLGTTGTATITQLSGALLK
jgi:rfaE bifunctional protein kinase chain/domain